LSSLETVDRAKVSAPVVDGSERVLTPGALEFIAALHQKFSKTLAGLLQEREARQRLFDSGGLPDFPADDGTRSSEWTVAEIPSDLIDRRVEITGPAGDRKMVINAFNSGASTFMADFEDSLSPTWEQLIHGQTNLKEAVERSIRLVTQEGKVYALAEKTATLIVRPRGLHLIEKHVKVGEEPVPASFFDFGVFLINNAEALRRSGSGPYFYLPKMEGAKEARLWEQILLASEDYLGLPRGTIKVTVLIETLPAAFEMEEILFELRGHIVGLNCGRWDYMFSFIKKLRGHPKFLLPERSQLTMDGGFLAPYVDLLIKTCHKRRAYAIGGMSAFIPIKGDEAKNEAALAKVRADKDREFRLGHDGTWVAHPGLVAIAKEAFSQMKGPNQLNIKRDEVVVKRDDLLRVPAGTITNEGLDSNVSVGLRYLENWLGGKGCVPINNLMEDAATTEICRAQLWQWIKHGGRLSDGTPITKELVTGLISGQVSSLSTGLGQPDSSRIALAGRIFEQMVTNDEFVEFITIPAYDALVSREGNAS
jgi:malate synthase